jgi:hypothetical protein
MRALSEIRSIMATEKKVINIPVNVVISLAVDLGRSPKIDHRRLPRFRPTISPTKAITALKTRRVEINCKVNIVFIYYFG